MGKIKLLSALLFSFLNYSSTFSQSQYNNVEYTIDSFDQRTEAIRLAKSEKWQEWIPIIESLTLQYQNDGDLFKLLGLSYYQTEHSQKVIKAFNKNPDFQHLIA